MSYWRKLDQIISKYKAGKYKKVKKNILRLLEIYDPCSQLLKYYPLTIRKIIKQYLSDELFQEALDEYEEYFRFCRTNRGFKVTEHDKRLYNKIIDGLEVNNPSVNKNRFLLQKKIRRPDFEIIDVPADRIELVLKEKSVPGGHVPRGGYRYIEHYSDGCWYIKNHYVDFPEGTATLTKTDLLGNILEVITIPFLIKKFFRQDNGKLFVVLNYLGEVVLFTEDGRKLADANLDNIRSESAHMFHNEKIGIIKGGETILFSRADKVYLFNRKLKLIQKISCQPTSLSESNISGRKRFRALSILDLTNTRDLMEIKSAFREKVRFIHPDTNPSDPEASEKTRDLIWAYQYLTKELDIGADHDVEYIELARKFRYAYQINEKVRTFLAVDDERLIICTELGSFYEYSVSSLREVKHLFDHHFKVLRVTKMSDYLIVESYANRSGGDFYIDTIQQNEIINSLAFEDRGRVYYYDELIIYFLRNQLKIHSVLGEKMLVIEFKKNIADVFLVDNMLKVVTLDYTFHFTIKSLVPVLPIIQTG